MKPEAITSTLVQSALENWQRGDFPPPELLQLRLAQHYGKTARERSEGLYRLCRAITTENLQLLRQEKRPTELSPLDTLKKDFHMASASKNPALRAWSALYHRYILDMPPKISVLASETGYSARNFRRDVRRGIILLTHMLRELELGMVQHRTYVLPPESSPLYGRQPLIEEISTLLRVSPVGVCLEGMAGVGKTALALEVIRHLSQRTGMNRIFWISASTLHFLAGGTLEAVPYPTLTLEDILAEFAQQAGIAEWASFPAEILFNRLKSVLQSGHYLMVLDNLDTVPDPEQLLLQLRRLPNLKFLLTSRNSLRHPTVQSIRTPELTFEASQALVQHELSTSGRQAALTEADMDAIYDAVGGSPFLLKFIAHQMGRLPLRHILRNLNTGQSAPVADVYAFLFQPAWQVLSDPSRLLLQSASRSAAETLSIGDLQRLSGLDQVLLGDMLTELVNHSLMDVFGSLQNPIYCLSRAVKTYCQMSCSPAYSVQE